MGFRGESSTCCFLGKTALYMPLSGDWVNFGAPLKWPLVELAVFLYLSVGFILQTIVLSHFQSA